MENRKRILRWLPFLGLWGLILAMPLVSLADDLPITVWPLNGVPLGAPGTIQVWSENIDPSADPLSNESLSCNGCVAPPQAGITFWQNCPVGGSPICSATWFISGPCDTTIYTQPSQSQTCDSANGTAAGATQAPQIPTPAITVDGATLPPSVFQSKAMGVASASPPTTQVTYVLEEAAALDVFDRLLVLGAEHDGVAATEADGRALAMKMLDLYTSKHINDPAVPKNDAAAYFLSPEHVKGYQLGESMRRERAVILAHVDASNDAARHAAIVAWFRAQLSDHVVTVVGGGLPTGFSLPDLLPESV